MVKALDVPPTLQVQRTRMLYPEPRNTVAIPSPFVENHAQRLHGTTVHRLVNVPATAFEPVPANPVHHHTV